MTKDYTVDKNENDNTEGLISENFDISRRKFLALLSASTAFAIAGCNPYRDKGEIVPYNKRPENIVTGKAKYYASTCDVCPNACGILIKTREGRPIKIDGNPEHPLNSGKICVRGQANILNLYDPERLKDPLKRNGSNLNPISWSETTQQISDEFKNASLENKKIAILTHKINSPSLNILLQSFINLYPNTIICSYDTFSEKSKIDAFKECYSSENIPLINFEKYELILSLNSDFLGTEGNFVYNIKQFSKSKDVINKNSASRLFVTEGNLSVTGAMADYRLKIRPDLQFEFILSIINELTSKFAIKHLPGVDASIFTGFDIRKFIAKNNLKTKTVDLLIRSLYESRGKAIILAGNYQSKDLHILVNYLNEILGNELNNDFSYNKQLVLSNTIDPENLFHSLLRGEISVLINLDTNPVFELPFKYSQLIQKVNKKITLSSEQNETTAVSDFILPLNHTLESWGDFLSADGIYSLKQPVISPLYNTRQKESILLSWIEFSKNFNDKETKSQYYDYLRNYCKENIFPLFNQLLSFEDFWFTSLHDGFINLKKSKSAGLKFNSSALNKIKKNEQNKYPDILLELVKSTSLSDYKFANNGWIQELPHPITKITWDNYVSMSKKTADKLGLKDYELVEIKVDTINGIFPVYIQPGLCDNYFAIELGYGRTNSGTVANNVGFNADKFININNSDAGTLVAITQVTKSGGHHKLASTVEKHAIDDEFLKDLAKKRHIIQEGTLKDYLNKKEITVKASKELRSITKEHTYKDVKWAMAIDLNKCIGCNACIISCNVENNIPVVGKEQVIEGREMMWMRIDRYYSGSEEDLKTHFQPMLCQHCDNAPCENVCPVVATTHSPDGLNQMTYNRCVGTRYCSNNCPYKVRRFNFYNFREKFKDALYESEPLNLMANPEVTIRSRGVMEKCTFCVQRLMEAKQEALVEGLEFKGDNVQTACQQACPANAIEFGNMIQPNSKIANLREHELAYYVLEELKVKPNVTYLAKLRNTESEGI